MAKSRPHSSRTSATAALLCEIHAPRTSLAASLADIAVICARDVGQTLAVKFFIVEAPVRKEASPPSLTLHLPVELAAGQHPVWCLACRLACFLPDARVSVLIQGEHAFSASRPRTGRRRVA
jgi:hypothetical protein